MIADLPHDVSLSQLGSVASTNDEVRRLADGGATGPLWVRADHQTQGRGRRGRTWASAAGNLYLSGLFTLSCSPQTAANLSFVTALAVAQALESYIAPSLIVLKWPNDILVDGGKLSGILLESWPSPLGLQIAIGIGVNLHTRPDVDSQSITCVAANLRAGAPPLNPTTMGVAVINAFHDWLKIWQVQGFAPIRAAWLARAKGVGERVVARLPQGELEGQFEGLGEEGALLLRLPTGERRAITSGEVFFGRPPHAVTDGCQGPSAHL